MMKIVDAHVHVHKPGHALPKHDLLPEGWGAPVERLVLTLDRHGVDGAVLVAVSPSEESYRYISGCQDRYPGRFAGIGVYTPNDATGLKATLRALDAGDIQGVRVFDLGVDESSGSDGWGADEVIRPVALAGGALWLFAPASQFDAIPILAKRYPEMPIVMNLLGFPWPVSLQGIGVDPYGRPFVPGMTIPPATYDSLLSLSEVDSVYVQMGGYFQYCQEAPYDELKSTSRDLFLKFGSERLIWMTDWPWIEEVPGYAESIRVIDEHIGDLAGETDLSNIMGHNIQRLLRF